MKEFRYGLRFLFEGGEGGAGGGAGGGGAGGAGGTGGNPGTTGQSLLNGEGAKGGGEAGGFKLPDGWDYRSALSEELRTSSSSAKKYGSLEDLVRGADSLQQMVGKDASRLVEIAPDIDAAGRRSVMERMGLPKDVTGYELKSVKGAEAILDVKSPAMQSLTAKAHELGIMPDQLQGLVDQFGSLQMEGVKALSARAQKIDADNVAGLRKELGETFDQFVAHANLAVEKLGGDALREAINNRGLGTDPVFLKAFAKIGEMLGEDGGGGDKNGAPGGNGLMTPDDALAKGRELLQRAIGEKDQFKRRELNAEAQKFFARANKGTV